jgi:hypothetical protein
VEVLDLGWDCLEAICKRGGILECYLNGYDLFLSLVLHFFSCISALIIISSNNHLNHIFTA